MRFNGLGWASRSPAHYEWGAMDMRLGFRFQSMKYLLSEQMAVNANLGVIDPSLGL